MSNFKKTFNVVASNGEFTKRFSVLTNNSNVDRIARQTAESLFYTEQVRILSIEPKRASII